MSYTAKSVILDIADNHGHTYMGLRSVDFYDSGNNLITTNPATYTTYATTTWPNVIFDADFVFDTSLAKGGTQDDTTWISTSGTTTNQRVICVFDTPIVFEYAVINNYHNSGATTAAGCNNTKLTISTDTITSTTYNDTITNATVFFDDVLRQHRASTVGDYQLILSPITRTDKSAKSIILDIADNWTHATYLSIRSIDFFKDGIRVDQTSINCTCYATTELSANALAEFAFYADRSKGGSWSQRAWIAGSTDITNQRLIIVFDASVDFDAIAINNGHDSGGLTNSGAKNTVITLSTDEITNTTYEAAITNSEVLFDDELDEHISSDTADYYIIELGAVTTTTSTSTSTTTSSTASSTSTNTQSSTSSTTSSTASSTSTNTQSTTSSTTATLDIIRIHQTYVVI